ncbi:MAG: DUF2889 domain-containing protein [Betaproteobacteria bacterium]|jgi:hypothetical protein|nr:DUF2889 domain-containing protein [Betaproteobacteria bacterium]
MPLSPPSPRQRLHTRTVRYEGHLREDGLFDIDASLHDVKDRDCVLLSGVRRAGEPVHDIHVRVTIDLKGVIRAIETHSDATPYPPYCADHDDAYAALVGTSLFAGFRKALYAGMGGVQGCTHITELLANLPTAAVQTFAGLQREDSGDHKPYQLDRCHALDTHGAAVRRYYPKWHRGPGEDADAPDAKERETT